MHHIYLAFTEMYFLSKTACMGTDALQWANIKKILNWKWQVPSVKSLKGIVILKSHIAEGAKQRMKWPNASAVLTQKLRSGVVLGQCNWSREDLSFNLN